MLGTGVLAVAFPLHTKTRAPEERLNSNSQCSPTTSLLPTEPTASVAPGKEQHLWAKIYVHMSPCACRRVWGRCLCLRAQADP